MLLFANAYKGTRKSTHGTRLCGVAQGIHFAIVLVSVSWSESVNIIYFLSHDIQHILYLVLLYDIIHFEMLKMATKMVQRML